MGKAARSGGNLLLAAKKSEDKMELSEVRQKINRIDTELLKILNERLECSREVADCKLKTQDDIYKPAREQEICQNFLNEGQVLNLPVIKSVMRNSRRYQYSLFLEAGNINENFKASFAVDNKKVFENGGELCLKLKADKTGMSGLTVGDILTTLGESEVEITKLEVKEDFVNVKLLVKSDETSRLNAYILSYMLYKETLH